MIRSGLFTLLFHSAVAYGNNIVSPPYEYTYLLPTFIGELTQPFVNATKTADASVNALLASAAKAPFISYDDEFLSILGAGPTIELIAERDLDFAFEAGVWVPERNEVFFTSSIIDDAKVGGTHFEVLNLKTKKINNLTTSEPVRNPNGGDYHNGLVYLTTTRSIGTKIYYNGGIVSIDPITGKVEHILNSYFGLQFTDIDDIAWATNPTTGKSYLYFTQFPFVHTLFPAAAPMGLANAVWRWDPQEKVLLPMISRTDIALPDGIRVSPDQKSLYVTDFAGPRWTSILGVSAEIGSPAIYKYDLDTEMRPVNRRLFGYPRMGGADGIHVDDKGRVWTAEGDGIVVRRVDGKVLGVFNSMYFGASRPSLIPIANFALAGDVLVVLGVDRIFSVKLAEVVVSGRKASKARRWSFDFFSLIIGK
jgi:gluconolactonase